MALTVFPSNVSNAPAFIAPLQNGMENIPSYANKSLTPVQFIDSLQKVPAFKTLDVRSLAKVFNIMDQELNKTIKDALVKKEGYFHRLFLNESWGEWLEDRTALGKVVNVFANCGASKMQKHLDRATVREANAQAKDLLKKHARPEDNEVSSGWKNSFQSFDSFFSRMINFIPGAEASSEGFSPAEGCCIRPIGSYEGSCFNATVTYLPEYGLCQIDAKCTTMFASIPPQNTTLTFPASRSVTLGNNNGTLTILTQSISMEGANQELSENFAEIEKVENALSDPGLGEDERDALEIQKRSLEYKQGQIVGMLSAGSVITLGDRGELAVVAPEKKIKPMYMSLQRLAQSTGGIVGISPLWIHLPFIIERIFDHILEDLGSKDLDIAIALDTTASMNNNIEQVKEHLIKFMKYLSRGTGIRVAIMEYRDRTDYFLHRIRTDFTSDFSSAVAELETVTVGGGDDAPEAAFDALLAAKSQLSWKNKETKHVVMLVSDAPPHPKTHIGGHDEAYVAGQFQEAGMNIVIYPIIT